MKTCPMCGDVFYTGDLLCFRCMGAGGRVRLEIYDHSDATNEPAEGFSEVWLGKWNYKDMQRKNIRRGGLD